MTWETWFKILSLMAFGTIFVQSTLYSWWSAKSRFERGMTLTESISYMRQQLGREK